jgi:hypothetical protein
VNLNSTRAAVVAAEGGRHSLPDPLPDPSRPYQTLPDPYQSPYQRAPDPTRLHQTLPNPCQIPADPYQTPYQSPPYTTRPPAGSLVGALEDHCRVPVRYPLGDPLVVSLGGGGGGEVKQQLFWCKHKRWWHVAVGV